MAGVSVIQKNLIMETKIEYLCNSLTDPEIDEVTLKEREEDLLKSLQIILYYDIMKVYKNTVFSSILPERYQVELNLQHFNNFHKTLMNYISMKKLIPVDSFLGVQSSISMAESFFQIQSNGKLKGLSWLNKGKFYYFMQKLYLFENNIVSASMFKNMKVMKSKLSKWLADLKYLPVIRNSCWNGQSV
jgi:hypothetical protein